MLVRLKHCNPVGGVKFWPHKHKNISHFSVLRVEKCVS